MQTDEFLNSFSFSIDDNKAVSLKLFMVFTFDMGNIHTKFDVSVYNISPEVHNTHTIVIHYIYKGQ